MKLALRIAMLVVLIAMPTTAADAQEPEGPVVDGVSLKRSTVAGVELFHDPGIEPDVVETAGEAFATSLAAVPTITGLPPFATSIVAYVLEDDERFRLALSELAGVRVDLVSEDIGGYTVERDGRMLVFFAAPNVATPASAVLGYTHELTHLAVREATRRRPLPQWFNEGYASWVAAKALDGRFPREATLQHALDRSAVASALHTRGLIPWPDLVTWARFSRAGVDGLVSLAYGQSTLFVDFLVGRHGQPAAVRFLTGIGEGQSATQAFGSSFGAFGSEAAAFDASLGDLRTELTPGLYLVQLAADDQPAVIVLVGGPALETAVVELMVDGELARRREIDLDGSGMLVASLPASLLEGGSVSVRVTAPVLGELELDPVHGTSVHPPTGVSWLHRGGGRQSSESLSISMMTISSSVASPVPTSLSGSGGRLTATSPGRGRHGYAMTAPADRISSSARWSSPGWTFTARQASASTTTSRPA